MAERLTGMQRPTLLLEEDETSAFSKLGGAPNLPPHLAWPIGVKGPQAFIAQLDLGVARNCGGPDWAPSSGALYVFLDDDRFGFGDEIRVLFSPTLGEAPAQFPETLGRKHRYKEKRLRMEHFPSTPSADWVDIDPGSAMIEQLEEDAALSQPPNDSPDHRLFGYPAEIQSGQLWLECEHLACGREGSVYAERPSEAFIRSAEDWRLLLQIDTDEQVGMSYGDGGMFYVFIREADARQADFSRTVTIPQTY
ncbi:DUF1963 domain-containing protein [Phenylobacterium immobile]|uniref:DUF1963 domain-containing protein n=1 Tax=Phenylobacterium immobile TaxID=21 RepID=UPI00159EC2C9|nr:YwqG family protein [Phenylobacterium immobile]